MTAQHTPGPWEIGMDLNAPRANWLVSRDCGDSGRGLAIAETRGDTGSELANVRLIAAAPDLLDALEKAKSALARCFGAHASDEGDRHRALAQARAAIAKATGEHHE